MTEPPLRALRAFPVTCPICSVERGHGCVNAWGRRVKYQHEARKRNAASTGFGDAT